MADQTLPLNVSYEMKADDERQNCVGMESDEELCFSSSDSAEELYSSSTTDACGVGSSDAVLWKIRKIGMLDHKMLWFEGKNWSKK